VNRTASSLLVVVTLCGASAPALARSISITRTSVSHVYATYLVRASSLYCDDGTLSCSTEAATCEDRVSLSAQDGKETTYVWDTTAKTARMTKETITLPAVPNVTVQLCATMDEQLGHDSSDVADEGFRYKNINGAELNFTPVSLRASGFDNAIVSGSVTWKGDGTIFDRINYCESYLDSQTATCFTFKGHVRTRNQLVSGTIKGTWASDFFIDPNCPAGTGVCTPEHDPVPYDVSPNLGHSFEAHINEAWGDAIVENATNGKCGCPIIETY
jgi:hypothetical protein